MIANERIDLSRSFDIEVLTCDCDMDMSGYSIDDRRRDSDISVHYVKMPALQ
jgi:hypothetical protein